MPQPLNLSQFKIGSLQTPDQGGFGDATALPPGGTSATASSGNLPPLNLSNFELGKTQTAQAPSSSISGLRNTLQSQGQSGYLSGLGARIGSEQVAGAQKAAQSLQEGANLANKGGAKNIAEGIGTEVFGGISGAAQSIFAPITALTSPIIQKEAPLFPKALALEYPQLAQLYKAFSPTIQAKVLPKIQTLAQKHPDATTLAGDLINTGLLAVGGGEAEVPVKEAVQEGLEGGIKGATDSLKQTVSDIPGEVKQGASDLKSNIKERYIQSEKDSWIKPTTKPIPAYNAATDIYNAAKSKGTNIEDILVNNGIKLSDNVDENAWGRQVFSTSDTASKVRSDAQKVTTDLLRPVARELDMSNPPVDTSRFIDRAISSIQGDNSIEREEKKPLIDMIKDIDFPETMSRDDLITEKVTRDGKSKYNVLGDVGSTRKVQVNKALADGLRGVIEEEVPLAKSVNKEASKLYDTANYLDALDTKPVAKSKFNRVMKVVGKAAGIGIGAFGGIGGEVAGYYFGGMLENAFENMTDPVKNAILDSLQREDPAVFNKVKGFLGDQETARLTRKALPPGAELGTAANPRIANAPLGSQATIEPQAQNINTEPTPKPAAQPPTLALPSGEGKTAYGGPTISLPPAGTYDKAALEKSGLNEMLEARVRNPADRRRLIQLLFPPR